MNFFVRITLFIMHVSLIYEVKGQYCDQAYYKLNGNIVDQLYARLLKTDHVPSRGMCAMRCCLAEMCRLFQFKDGQCKLLKQETMPGMGITSLIGMTEVWSVDIGKTTNLIRVINGVLSSSYITFPAFVKWYLRHVKAIIQHYFYLPYFFHLSM